MLLIPFDLPPSLNEAVRLLCKLGGHLGRTMVSTTEIPPGRLHENGRRPLCSINLWVKAK
jgi:hypothetical protein